MRSVPTGRLCEIHDLSSVRRVYQCVLTVSWGMDRAEAERRATKRRRTSTPSTSKRCRPPSSQSTSSTRRGVR